MVGQDSLAFFCLMKSLRTRGIMKIKHLVATFLSCCLILQAQDFDAVASIDPANDPGEPPKLEALAAVPIVQAVQEEADMDDELLQTEEEGIVDSELLQANEEGIVDSGVEFNSEAEFNSQSAEELNDQSSEISQSQDTAQCETDSSPCCPKVPGPERGLCPCLPEPCYCAPPCSEEDMKVVIPCLKGLLLHCSSKSVRVNDLDYIEGVQVEDVDIPGSCNALYKYLGDYWARPVTKCDIIDIKRKVILFYREHNRPVVHIQVPPQAVKSGVLQLVVYESRLGCVRALCNQYFNSEKLEGYIRTCPGDRIRADRLVNDLNWINRNPFRTTDLVFTPSTVEGYTDIELVTQDRYPWRIYTGVDNTGIAQSGHNRWFAGFNWGNVFGWDHIFTYQFTSGTHYNEFWAHSGNYTAPLPWRHTLDLYGGYSEVRADLQGVPGVLTHGSSGQVSFRYEIPLPPGLSILEEFTWGFDWKNTNTNLLNNDIIFFGKTVNITQLMVGINAGLETARTKNSGTIEVFWSPGQWFPNQENSHYNDLRAGAKNAYVYGRASVASIFRLPSNFTFEPSIRWQLSSANLLASEQFGLGGYNTVRGYEEREVNGDNAIIVNVELRTAPVSALGWWERCARNFKDELRFLVFLDYGYGKNHKLYFNEREFQYLMGAGPGVRYVIQRYLTVRCDYGFKLRQIDFGPNPNRGMLHFGVVLSY